MAKKYGQKILTVLIYVLFFAFMIAALSEKINYHVDEVYSYGLANRQSDGTISMKVKKGKIYENPHLRYMRYMTVDEEHRFDYKNVWINQKNDVHPPLYYACLHTVSSFFPGEFSLWQAGAVNIVFLLLALFMVHRLALYLTEDETLSFMIFAGFAFCSGVISAATFLRMYCMVIFWVLLLSYLFVRLYREGASRKLLVSVFATTVLSALTHYYCIVFVVLLSGTLGIFWILGRKWKPLLIFSATMCGGGLVSVLCFPAMIQHMFFGYRGEEAIANLQSGTDYLEKIKTYFGYLNGQVFGDYLPYLLLGLLLVAICGYFKKAEYALLYIPMILYCFLVSKMAPFFADRYMFPIYGLAFCLVFSHVASVIKKRFGVRLRILLLGVLLAVVLTGSFRKNEWPYLFKNTQEILYVSASYSDHDCICIYV